MPGHRIPLADEAVELFQSAMRRAIALNLNEPNAATLATVGSDGQPSARVVLVRRHDELGFVFFTNSESRKGCELAGNPRAALCFYWDALHEQIRIEGQVESTSEQESDEYWSRRQRESQIGAWASNQSSVLEHREWLEQRIGQLERQFAGVPIPRPAHWHGYRLVPTRIEFWTGQPARLHDRLVFEATPTGWRKFRLCP